MTKKELKGKVDDIISLALDDEAAHFSEDRLHLEVIDEFCPVWVKKEINRLAETDFERWCA